MNVKALQTALGVTADGLFGPLSKAALLNAFSNTHAPTVTQADLIAFASKLGCTTKQLAAVASVESSGSGFDANGRPKMLFERHLFHRLTEGRWSPSVFSSPNPGGYGEDSWDKLAAACGKDPDAAFGASSWGKFQVLGLHWSALGYESAFALAHSCVASEAAHYDLLARYIDANHLQDALAAISTDPETCRAFAKAFNGPGYATNGAYHVKLSRAMQ